MAHPPEMRVALRAAYVSGLSLELAAAKAGVPFATARNWKRAALDAGDNWDTHQGASLLAAGGGMEQAIGRLTAAIIRKGEATLELMEADPDMDPIVAAQAIASLTDSLNKAANVARKGMPEADKLAIAMDVIKRFGAFLRESAPQHAAAFAELLPAFGQDLAKAYG